MIIRIKKTSDNPFVQIDKRPLEDDRLSFKAKGVLAYLLSRPDDWTVRLEDLAKRSTDGKGAVRSALKELSACGYARLEDVRNEKGRLAGKSWVIYEQPTDITKTDTSVATDIAVSRTSEKPNVGKSNTTNKEVIQIKNDTNITAGAVEDRYKTDHSEFIAKWVDEYAETFHRPYKFQSGKDGAAVKRLVRIPSMTPEKLMAVARIAWRFPKKFNCKQAVSLTGFDSRFNEICAEVADFMAMQPAKTSAAPETF